MPPVGGVSMAYLYDAVNNTVTSPEEFAVTPGLPTGDAMNAAFGIGDGGQVTGYCTTPSGGQDALPLTPTPEPSRCCCA